MILIKQHASTIVLYQIKQHSTNLDKMAELATIAEVYTPSVNSEGRYIDCIPANINISGARCPCGSTTVFCTRISFSNHIKTKKHVEWLERVNNENRNYLAENIGLKEQLVQQRKIIASLSNQLEATKIELRAGYTKIESIKTELDDTKTKLIQCLMSGSNNSSTNKVDKRD
jgi:hypothetical protein